MKIGSLEAPSERSRSIHWRQKVNRFIDRTTVEDVLGSLCLKM